MKTELAFFIGLFIGVLFGCTITLVIYLEEKRK